MEPLRERSVPFFHSLLTKTALTYLLLMAAVLILLNTYPLFASQNLVFQSKETALKSQASVLSSSLGVADTLTAEGVGQAMEVLLDESLARVLVTDAAGLILYDSHGEDNLYRYALFGEIHGALQGKDVTRTGFADGVFSSRAAAPILYRRQIIGAVYLYDRDEGQGALLLGVQTTLRTISLILCGAVILFSLLSSRVLARRFDKLLHAIATVRQGEYNHRVALPGKDELALLAGEFDRLTGRLQVTEEARRRFVSDASHELKTPLASIRLLTDSILQNPEIDPAMVREFVSDIGDEADRLTRISEKLLTLTRLDAEVVAQRESVDLAGVARKVARLLEPLAREKDILLDLALDGGCTVLATGDDLFQVLFNLVENAIKYNRPGGRVTLSLYREEGSVLLRVCDTGVGIPEEDREKIFDRFYRVDKARSRAAGGTGLGLSIVRDTVLLHGGTISVAPNEPEGTCFTVAFPLCQEVEA